MQEDSLQTLHSTGLISDIDLHFARLVKKLGGAAATTDVCLAAALASNITTGEKHICLDLAAAADTPVLSLFPDYPGSIPEPLCRTKTPGVQEWVEKISACPVIGVPGEYKPLIIDENRLYLYRFWWYERELARLIKRKLAADRVLYDTNVLKKSVDTYFADATEQECWQKIAAFAAAANNFCVISGKPGAGKTYTVARILAILLEQDEGLTIRLCAPTGKASARLQESIVEAKKNLHSCPDEMKEKIPADSSTIHRLLGYLPHRFAFHHNRRNPVLCDILVVDEASMVPLILLSKLLLAVPEKTKVILLGDKDQLASVEAGAAFADICEVSGINRFSEGFCSRYREVTGEEIPQQCRGTADGLLSDFSVELRHSFRFDPKLGIGRLANAVNTADSELALKILKNDATGCLSLKDVPEKSQLKTAIGSLIEPFYKEMLSSETPDRAFEALKKIRVLCSHRNGYHGSVNINRLAELYLAERDMIPQGSMFYKGRPIMITRNDYTQRLFNGDVGIIWEDAGGMAAFFEDRDGELRRFLVVQLPEYEPVFAMTVHKSQGSEFDRVLLIMPDRDSPVLTRELFYTALTRAKKTVEIWAQEDVLKNTLHRRVTRLSGLKQALLNAPQNPE